MSDIPLTISETHDGLKRGAFSVVELVDSYLARINNFDKNINSFITVTDEIAYKQAKEADRIIKDKGDEAFEEFPLLGVVVSYKDMFLTKGVRTTAASNVLKDYIPQYSATVVKRIQNAGAVMMGKLNHDAWAHGASGENSDFGVTKNPWDVSRVPGGSSSGSGAAMAANFSLIATGTDTGGSIRCPANFTGVYGFKPTYGTVSRYGIVAMASSTDSVGHFGRSVDDIDRVYQVTKGTDGKDSTLVDPPIVPTKSKYTIGIPKEYFVDGVEKEVLDNVRKAIDVYKSAGVEFLEVELPHTKYAISVYYVIQTAEVASNLGRYDGVRFGNSRESFGAEAKRRIMLGTYVLSSGYYDAYYLKAQKVRSKIIQDFDSVFERVDALIAPVVPTPAFKIGEKSNDPLQMYLADIFTVSANMAGIPGLAVPYGMSNSNLPLGFQLMGARFSEPILFDLARIFERETEYNPQVARL